MATPLFPPGRGTDPRKFSGDPFEAVQEALTRLPDSAASGLSFVAAAKQAWNLAREEAAELNRQKGGRAAG
jgi:hypothetical protein